MPIITIEIPKKVLQNRGARRLLAVDPKEFEKELRRKWEAGEENEFKAWDKLSDEALGKMAKRFQQGL